MGYKHCELDPAPLLTSLAKPNFLLKVIPHVDSTPRVCELVRYYCEGVTPKGAWRGNLRAVQRLLGHTEMNSTVLYLRVELGNALSSAECIAP